MQEIPKNSSRWKRFKSLFEKGHFDVYVPESDDEKSPGVLWLNVHLTGDISIHIFPTALNYSQEKLEAYYAKASVELRKVLGLLKSINKFFLITISLPVLIDFCISHLQQMIQAGFEKLVVLQEFEELLTSPKSILYYTWLLLLFVGKRLIAYFLRKRLGM